MAELLSQNDLNDLFAGISLDGPEEKDLLLADSEGADLVAAGSAPQGSSGGGEILDQDDIDDLLAQFGKG
jgi:hypothetical protein